MHKREHYSGIINLFALIVFELDFLSETLDLAVLRIISIITTDKCFYTDERCFFMDYIVPNEYIFYKKVSV